MSLSLAKQRLNETPLLCLLSTFCPKASHPCKWAIKTVCRVFIHNFRFFNCNSNSLSSSSNSACHLSHSELKSCCSRSTPSKISSPSSLCTGCHLLPTLPKKSWGFKKVGAIWNRVNSHWALISYLSLECLNLKQHVRQMKRWRLDSKWDGFFV